MSRQFDSNHQQGASMSRFTQSALWRSGILLALVLASSSASAAILICRGGQVALRGMSADLHGAFRLDLTYRRYTGPAEDIRSDGMHLGPGECSQRAAHIPETQSGGIFYYTYLENFAFDVSIRRNTPGTKEDYGWLALNPLVTDTVLAWVPTIYDFPESKIFDASTYWIFATREVGNSYQLTLTRRVR
jgi:hypothetical protein